MSYTNGLRRICANCCFCKRGGTRTGECVMQAHAPVLYTGTCKKHLFRAKPENPEDALKQ